MRRALPAVLALTAAVTACGATSSHREAVPPAHTATSASTPPATPGASSAAGSRVVWHPRHVAVSTVSWRLPVASSRQALITAPGGQVLLAGGMLADGSSTADVRRIDLATGRVVAAPSLAVPVHDAAGGPYGGAPAVFGGGNSSEQSLVQALRGGRWSRVDQFPTGRSDLSVVPVAGRTVALGGYDGSVVPREVFAQRGTTSLHRIGRLTTGVRYAATAAVGHAVLVFGGEVAGHELAGVQRLDARTGRTRTVAQLPVPLGHASAVTLGDRVLLVGGRISPHLQTRRMWWFDPLSGRFSRAGQLPRRLSDAAVAVLGRHVYLLGGEQPGVTDLVVRLDVR